MPGKSKKKIAASSATADGEQIVKAEPAQEPISEPEPAPKPKKTRAKKAAPAASTGKAEDVAPVAAGETAAAASEPAAKPAKKKRTSSKVRTVKITIRNEVGEPVEISVPAGASVADPIGDLSDGEAHASFSDAEPAARSETQSASASAAEPHSEAHGSGASTGNEEAASAPEDSAELLPPARLERLQKILAQAGIASRRRAEEMIVAGRVVVNGQLVTQLGAKADPVRDHIRVDGKLLAGAERHRYFVLNKPRGYVTTVSDPEGRPTVMQFFARMHERLYPVGRLDYQSEGLLLVTNDGELANKLTHASSRVEKTYLVKVAGQPTEQDLARLRSGVSIERDRGGSERVDTAPAEIRQIRQGDNPWYEVVLIEGRNRELRKMFEQIGRHVEKIRRVGYGSLVLDVEPGKLRELRPDEVTALRLTAEGRLKPRRPRAAQMLPREAGRPAEDRPAKRGDRKPFTRRPEREAKPQQRGESRRFGGKHGESRQFDDRRGARRPFRSRNAFESTPVRRFEGRDSSFRPQQRTREPRGEDAPRRGLGNRGGGRGFKGAGKPGFNRTDRTSLEHTDRPRVRDDRPAFNRSERPSFKRDDRPAFKRRDRRDLDFGGQPPRPAGKQFGGRPSGKPASRPAGKKFAPGSASGRKFKTGSAGKPGSRPPGKFRPNPGPRKRS